MKKNVAVQLTNISKKYEIHHEKPTLVEKFINKKNETFWALKDINLVINSGEKIGIIGRNGSGKTTLLKIIAGITSPTAGMIESHGKTVSLIDLDAGFHPDLTGEQNIYLNAMILGMEKEEIDNKIKQIIDFADIGQFIDAPLFTFSTGMMLRLGFSIAVHTNPDILILDESMAIGDVNFHSKAMSKIQEFFRAGKTIIVVSHWLDFIKSNCSRVYLMQKGNITHVGKPKQIIEKYLSII